MPRACRIRSNGSGSRAIVAMPRTTGSTPSPARPSPRSGLLRRSLRRTLGGHRLLLGLRLFELDIEHFLRAVAGIVTFDQSPDLGFAGAAEVERAAYFARRSLLHLGNAERHLAAYLHMTRRDAFDEPVNGRPIALGARSHRIELALYRPQAVFLGHHDVAELCALDLGVAAPDKL